MSLSRPPSRPRFIILHHNKKITSLLTVPILNKWPAQAQHGVLRANMANAGPTWRTTGQHSELQTGGGFRRVLQENTTNYIVFGNIKNKYVRLRHATPRRCATLRHASPRYIILSHAAPRCCAMGSLI